MFRRKPKEPLPPPEWLIVGLGNPGPEYAHTRHNVGFDVVERLAARHRVKMETRKHRAVYGVGTVAGTAMALAKPLTYMNLSGQAVAPLLREFGLGPDRLLVVADELDFPVGRVQLRPKGGPAGHNGHRSLIGALGTEEYARVRIGIDKGEGATVDHVLNRFSPDERRLIDEVFERCIAGIERLPEGGVAAAMNVINVRGEDSG